MNLDELQSVQSRERQASSLQHLRDTFYQDAGEYVRELHDRRDEAAAAADDPFGSEEVRRLSDDIETAERTVEAIYERRIGKIVKMASIAAADMPYDDDGLTEEEGRLFEDLVASIETNRDLVLSVLDGEAPGFSCSRSDADDSAVPTSEPSTVEDAPAADADRPTPDAEATPPDRREEAPPAPPEEFAIGDAMGGASASEDEAHGPAPDTSDRTAEAPAAEGPVPDEPATEPAESESSEQIRRTTVRITADVGDIFGVDGRAYDLSSEDVVTLPEENATVLTDSGQAERLE
jgi:DNA replication factor GINS